jgi:hypothetical protein
VGILDQLTADQRANATTIVAEVKRLGGTQRDAEAAITAAVDESGIRVLANSNYADSMALPHVGVGSDHTSVGIFQQQIGWGGLTTAQRMDPAASADAFIRRLIGTPNRTGLSVPMLVQSVQQSGTPDGSNYAHAAAAGTAYADALWTGTNPGTGPAGGDPAGTQPAIFGIPGTPSLPSPSDVAASAGTAVAQALGVVVKPLGGFVERGTLIVLGGAAVIIGLVLLAHNQGAVSSPSSSGGSSGSRSSGSSGSSGGSGGRTSAPAPAPEVEAPSTGRHAAPEPGPSRTAAGPSRGARGTGGARGTAGKAGKAGKSGASKSAGATAADAAEDVAVLA